MTTEAHPRDWKEARRLRASALKRAGWSQHDITEALGVTQGAVSQWMKARASGGVTALYARPHTGGPVKLDEARRALIPELLSHGAEAYGFRGEVWTCARIAAVIEREFGVAYHKAQVSRILKQLEWTPQKPVKRATQRDETRIAEWRTEVWPELKKRPGVSVAPLCLLTNRDSISCPRSSEPMRPAARRLCCASERRATLCR